MKNVYIIGGSPVDVVGSGHTVDFPDESFDITISCECFEHNPFWVETFLNMHRMTKRNGLVIVSCASRGRLEHGTVRTSALESPGTQSVGIDYYRNLNAKDFQMKIDLANLFYEHKLYYSSKPMDLYFIGWKSNKSISANTFRLFDMEIKKIDDIQLKVPVTLRSPFSFLYRLPLKAAMYILDDPNYQNFAMFYPRLLLTPRKVVNKIFGLNTVTHGLK